MPLVIRKRGRFYSARGTIPSRQADGRIVRVRHEESLRTERKADALRKAADIERYYHDLAYGNIKERGPTFAQAAVTYLETRGKGDRFLGRLIKHFGETPIAEIDQAAVADAAHSLYPGRSASTLHRTVYSPLITILRLSGVRTDLRRPKIQRAPINTPLEGWFDAVLPHCPPRLAALIVFLTLTGRRISEAIALTEADLDGTTVSISRTKTGVPVSIELPALVRNYLNMAERIPYGPGHRPSKRLFGYSSKDNAHRALKRICDLHGIPYFSSHKFGRHAFATRLLKQGWSVKHVARAGGWKSPMMVLKTYGYLEQDEVMSDVRKVQDQWTAQRNGGKLSDTKDTK